MHVLFVGILVAVSSSRRQKHKAPSSRSQLLDLDPQEKRRYGEKVSTTTTKMGLCPLTRRSREEEKQHVSPENERRNTDRKERK